MIAIIDYGAGNLRSVEKAFDHLGEACMITGDAKKILAADHVVLPGVGAFKDAMEHLRERGLDRVIRQVVEEKKPLLGICLGLQLLFESSEESPGIEGLSILPGKILRIPDQEGLKIPHIGWNSLEFSKESRLFAGLEEDAYVYFVHSYYLQAKEEQMVAAVTDYSVRIHAAVEQGNIFACQFHPEKSGAVGLSILKNFAQIKGGTC